MTYLSSSFSSITLCPSSSHWGPQWWFSFILLFSTLQNLTNFGQTFAFHYSLKYIFRSIPVNASLLWNIVDFSAFSDSGAAKKISLIWMLKLVSRSLLIARPIIFYFETLLMICHYMVSWWWRWRLKVCEIEGNLLTPCGQLANHNRLPCRYFIKLFW